MSKHVLKQSHLKIVYNSLIHSHLTYSGTTKLTKEAYFKEIPHSAVPHFII